MDEVKLKAIDFFCGAGGVTCGFSQAGIEVLAGIDIDLNCKETYEKNNPSAKFINADISKYGPEQLQEEFGLLQNDDNLIFVGCSPCQYYTIIHTSKEKASKGKLLLEEFRRFVDFFNPGYIFIENVPGIESKNETPLSSFKNFISSKGYICNDRVINAADYNVPQNRRRYVLMATRLNDSLSIPNPVTEKISARSVFEMFPAIPAGYRDNDSSLMHWTSDLHEINIQRLHQTPHNGGTRLAWKEVEDLQLNCYKNKDHIFIDVYGRMFWNSPAPTITTKFLHISNGRFAHPEQNRAISLREGASLQSFPTTYVFYSNNMGNIAKMIGNAVPPQMAKAIGKSLIHNWDEWQNSKQEQGR